MRALLRHVVGIDCGALVRHPRHMDLTSADPERQRRRLRLLAELAEARAAREARWRGASVRGSRVRGARRERIRELIATRRRLAG